jgi:hypothetical protein
MLLAGIWETEEIDYAKILRCVESILKFTDCKKTDSNYKYLEETSFQQVGRM